MHIFVPPKIFYRKEKADASTASSINLDLSRIKKWWSPNLANFNADKIECCLISKRVDKDLPDDSFDSNSLQFRDNISMLGVILESYLYWNYHITSVEKAAACMVSLAFISWSDTFSRSLNLLHYTRVKFAPVSNMTWSILLPTWMQYRGELDAILRRFQTNRRSSINWDSRLLGSS